MKINILCAAFALSLLSACGKSADYYRQVFALGKAMEMNTQILENAAREHLDRLASAAEMNKRVVPLFELNVATEKTLRQKIAVLDGYLRTISTDEQGKTLAPSGGQFFAQLEKQDYQNRRPVNNLFNQKEHKDSLRRVLEEGEQLLLSALDSSLAFLQANNYQFSTSAGDSLRKSFQHISQWEKYQIEGCDVAQAALVLTRCRNELIGAWAALLCFQREYTQRPFMEFNPPQIVVHAQQARIHLGEEYVLKYDLVQLAKDTNNRIQYEIAGKRLEKVDGGAIWSEKITKAGKRRYQVKAIITNPYTGESISTLKDFFYEASPAR